MVAPRALSGTEVSELVGDSSPTGRMCLPCSQPQQRFWFEEQLNPGNPGLNVAVRWRLEGDVSNVELEESWRRIIARHQTLRTSLAILDGEPVQFVEPHVGFTLCVIDLSGLPANAAHAEADRLAERHARAPFDLALAPLIRVTRLILGERVSILLVTAHHTVCDGWSIGILAQEMGTICAALRARETPNLPELPVTYGDYAIWERRWLSESALTAETVYSERLLKGYKHFELLTDRPRPAVQSSNGNIVSVLLERELTTRLDRLAQESGCTPFMVALAAVLSLLHRYSGETDITVGTQVAGRDEAEFEGLVGCFINTIALRTDLSGEPTFLELLARVCDTVSETFEIRHFPLERLIEVINPKRDLTRNALFSVNFIYQRSFIKNENFGAFTLIDLPSCSAGALYDLNFFMVERPEGWRASCEYNTDLFDRETIETMLAHFEHLLRTVLADPSQMVSTIPILSEAERHALIVERNCTYAAYPADQSLPHLLKEQVHLRPEATAVVCGEEMLTYSELAQAVRRTASSLLRGCHAPHTRIGVYLERSTDLLASLLGVLEAGSAYVPLDPSYPAERIASIIQDAQLAALITHSSLRGHLLEMGVPVIAIDDVLRSDDSNDVSTSPPLPDDLAYVIYTSGSTGKPKGVQISHRALANFLCSMRDRPGLTSADTLLAVTTISFDIAALEFYLPLAAGAKLVIAKESETTDGEALLALLRRSSATMMQATPVTWQLLIEAGWHGDPALRMLCGGEALSRTLAEQLLERGDELWNMYGPTETTIWSSALRLESGDGPVLIGSPIANTQFYVLDGRGELVVPGMPGELFIGGDGVALGYFGLPEMTAERFVAERFRDVPGARLYKTGDLVRMRPNGCFEFLGRNDQQIKLRGFRIELGEIESALLREPDVAEAVVIANGNTVEDKAIVAYAVRRETSAEPAESWADALRARIALSLPRYMVPARIVLLEALPRTPNGKVDRRALPAPQGTAEVPIDGDRGLTSTQATLTRAIAELLGRESLGVDDDIFALGFHSLLAVRLVGRLRESAGVELPLRVLFTFPTVRGLAQWLETLDVAEHVALDTPIATLNAHGARPPFVYLHSDLYSEGLYSRRIAAVLGDAQPLHAVAPHGTANLSLLLTVEAMARDYLDRIRAVQPSGPYRIGGFCASGLVAYELARLLRAQGEIVQDVILVNAAPLPRRAIPIFDWLIRKLGLNARLEPGIRETLVYYLARLHAALVTGPRETAAFFMEMTRGLRKSRPRRAEPDRVDKSRGTRDTENSFAHLVASLTYHPQPYDGRVTLIWSTDTLELLAEPTAGWRSLAAAVRVIPVAGSHVSVLHEDVAELGAVLEKLLKE